MKNGGWPNDLRIADYTPPVNVIMPNGEKKQEPPTFFEKIPNEQKNFRRLRQDEKIWKQEHKAVWLNR